MCIAEEGGLLQDVVLALLVKEPSHGYDLRMRLAAALGPLGETLNAGQVYVTLTRLEKALVILTAVGALTALPAWAHTRHPAGRALNTEPV